MSILVSWYQMTQTGRSRAVAIGAPRLGPVLDMPPPPEPMLLFAASASVVYTALWWLWWTVVRDDGVELQYSE